MHHGLAIFKDVHFGEYKVKELKILPNYILSDKTLDAKITKDGEEVRFDKFTN